MDETTENQPSPADSSSAGDEINVGDVAESTVAVGRGARAETHYHHHYGDSRT